MCEACGDLISAAEHVNEGRHVGRRAVADLTGGIETRAQDGAAGREDARMALAGVDLRHAGSDDLNRANLVRRRPVAQLTAGVVTPALYGAATCEGARMEPASADTRHRPEQRARNRGE